MTIQNNVYDSKLFTITKSRTIQNHIKKL